MSGSASSLAYKARKDLVFWLNIAVELASGGEQDFKSMIVVLEHVMDTVDLCKHKFSNQTNDPHPHYLTMKELRAMAGKECRPPVEKAPTTYQDALPSFDEDLLSVKKRSLDARPDAKRLFDETTKDILRKLGPKRS